MKGTCVKDRHWFDDLHRTLAHQAPRRGLIRSASALLIGFTLGANPLSALGKKKKRKGKNRSDPWGCTGRFRNLNIRDPNCSGGACKAQWPQEPCEQKYCEFICNQCDEDDPREFCIGRLFNDREAFCCPEGRTCCGSGSRVTCCAMEFTCCGGECCGAVGPRGRTACCKETCRYIDTDRDHCGGCSNPCNTGEVCVAGFCVPGPDRPGCNPATCPFAGMRCIDGECACPVGERVCNGACTPDYQPCAWITNGETISICIPPDSKCCPEGFVCPSDSTCCPGRLCYESGGCPA